MEDSYTYTSVAFHDKKMCISTWLTANTNIITVSTAIAVTKVTTVHDTVLRSIAVDVVHKDWATSLTKCTRAKV